MGDGGAVICSHVLSANAPGRLRPTLGRWAGACGLLVLAVAWFWFRGLQRSVGDLHDFRMLYAVGRSWLNGVNPYQFEALLEQYRSGGGWVNPDWGPHIFHALYPPTSCALLAPVAALGWSAAMWTLLGVKLALLAAAWVALAGRPLKLTGPGAIVLLAAVLVLAPLHSDLAAGQISSVTMALAVLGLVAVVRGWAVRGGILLALAFALKFQVLLLLPLWLLVTRRWRALAAMVAAGVVIAAAAAIPMHLNTPTWWADMLANIQAFGHGGFGDPRDGPWADRLLNLHLPLHGLIHSRLAVNVIVAAVGLVMLLPIIPAGRAVRGQRHGPTEMLIASLCLVVGLLMVYHRLYDAVVLIVPIAWSLWALDRWPRLAWTMLGLCVIGFAVPAAPVVDMIERRLPADIVASPLWRFSIESVQVWLALAVGLCIDLALLRRARWTGADPAQAERGAG